MDLGHPTSWKEPDELEQLRKVVPLPIPWSRRNRKILQLALTRHLEPIMPFALLIGLTECSSYGFYP